MAEEPNTEAENLIIAGDVVHICPDERYLLTLKGWENDPEGLLQLYHRLDEWWKSDEQFFVLGLRDGTELTLERIEPEVEAQCS